MLLLVQNYLKNKSLEDLEREHGVEVSINNYKFALNYNLITSKEKDPLAKQCRGLILRTKDGSTVKTNFPLGKTVILAYPFDRFFNHNQDAADKIDWNSAIIQEKLDGSLAIVYYDDLKEDWFVATRSVPEANNFVDGFNKYTFRTLFEKCLNDTYGLSFNNFKKKLNLHFTYCFEICSPINRIVVEYNKYELYLLGVRNNETFEELNPKEFNFKCPKEFFLNSYNDIIEFVNQQDPNKMEGVVIRDKFFKRIKIKSIAYVAAHKIKDAITSSPRNCLSLILEEKTDDVLKHLPQETQNEILEMKNKTSNLLSKLDNLYIEISSYCKTAKDFADLVNRKSATENIWTAPLFAIWRNKANNTLDFIKKKKKNGKYPNSILDILLKQMGYK